MLNKEELEISLESPIFEGMVEEANETIQEVVEQLLKGGFEKGHVLISFDLSLIVNEHVLISFDLSLIVNEHNKDLKAPKLDYKVNSSCKKEAKKKGSRTSTNTIQERDGVYVEVPVENPQQSLL